MSELFCHGCSFIYPRNNPGFSSVDWPHRATLGTCSNLCFDLCSTSPTEQPSGSTAMDCDGNLVLTWIYTHSVAIQGP